MSIYNLRTAMSAPVSINCYPNRTPEEYAANVAARFGGTLPSLQELARLESKAMRERLQTNPGAEIIGRMWQSTGHRDRALKQAEMSSARIQSIDATIFGILAQGEATARDVQRVLGLHLDTTRDHLRRLRVSGRIHAVKVRDVQIYSLPRAEAAE